MENMRGRNVFVIVKLCRDTWERRQAGCEAIKRLVGPVSDHWVPLLPAPAEVLPSVRNPSCSMTAWLSCGGAPVLV